jgi:formylglycine-generating enzyme required for sulfatase activity
MTNETSPSVHPHSQAAGAAGIVPGTLLWNRYEAVAPLGESLLGKIWLCRDTQADGAEVALRWLPPDVRRSKALLSVIHDTIRRIADSEHPNVAPVRQMVYAGTDIYLVGDYAPGITFAGWAVNAEGESRSLDELLPVLEQVAAALDFAHGKGVVHGNLTPTNVFLDESGTVRVTDFGLAFRRHTTMLRNEEEGEDEATLAAAFRAPEWKSSGEPDSAGDQYSLAALACWALTGGEVLPSAAAAASWAPAAKSAFRRALNPDPFKRFLTCSDFVRALKGERVGGRRRHSSESLKKTGRVLGLTLGAAALLALAGGVVVGIANVLGRSLAVDTAEAEPAAEPAAPDSAPRAPRGRRGVEPLVATTPLPEEGKPWVASTVPMEFVWVFEMQMWIGRFEVTNDEYREMDPGHASGRFKSPKGTQEVSLEGGRQPVVSVNFKEACNYARWLTEREREAGKLPDSLAYRLPTAEEAGRYIRAGGSVAYPWGDSLPPSFGNYADEALAGTFADMPAIEGYRDGAVCTAEVQDSGENAWGLFGAGGNVWETTSREPSGEHFGGWMGGAWDDFQPNRLLADARYGFRGDAHGMVNGFRLVLAPVGDE